MTIALIGDLHGNMPAVEALDKDLKRRKIDTVYCLGDLVGKGPSNAETMDWALERCQVNLRGNWDEGVGMKQFPNDTFYHRQLGEKRLKILAELPLEHHFTLSGRKIRLLHGRPVMDEPYFIHESTKDLEKYFLEAVRGNNYTLTPFFTRPIAIVLWVLIVAFLGYSIWDNAKGKRMEKAGMKD